MFAHNSMIARMKPMLCLIMLAMAVCAVGSDKCRSTLTDADVAYALGPKVRIQPAFSNGEMKGWRVYGTQDSKQLAEHAISEGSLLTHVCGIPANEVFKNKGIACCEVETSREFQVRISDWNGNEKKFPIKREKWK